jgi:hypothetical protein
MLLRSGFNFFIGVITGAVLFRIHNDSNMSSHCACDYEALSNLPPLMSACTSSASIEPISPGTSASSISVPVAVAPIEPIEPIIHVPPEASTKKRSADNHTRPLVDNEEVFPESMKSLFHRMGRVSRDDFASKFDLGYGIEEGFPENDEVLIIYGSENSLPKDYTMDGTTVVPQQQIADATENCDVMKIVVTDPLYSEKDREEEHKGRKHKQCIAIMGNWGSYHLHKYKRVGKRRGGQLEYSAAHRTGLPSREEAQTSNSNLLTYLSIYEEAREKLRSLADKAARGGTSDGKLGPVVVMVANHGQSQFFINFVCAAKSRGLDISRILLFATDLETYQLAESMGIAAFFDDSVFGSIPSGAAKNYHDMDYGRIMMSKVYCVHLVNSLGYDLLFQDIDLVWYKNPLEYFKTTAPQEFDMYFQHDGFHRPERFAPLAANTGFYYVRHNARTEYFFSVFVRMGDLVLTDKSHQAALNTLANEHMSLRGLRVKVLAKDMNLFPCKFQQV